MTDEQAYEIAKTVIQKYLISFNTVEAVQEAFAVINDHKTALTHIEILLNILEKAKKIYRKWYRNVRNIKNDVILKL